METGGRAKERDRSARTGTPRHKDEALSQVTHGQAGGGAGRRWHLSKGDDSSQIEFCRAG